MAQERIGKKLTGQSRLPVDEWPRLLIPLVQKYGAERVLAAGLQALRFPPQWCRTYKEVMAIEKQIENENENEKGD